MWSFKTSNLDLIIERANNFNIKVISDVEEIPNSRFFNKRRIILRDPDGFQIEIIEDNIKEKILKIHKVSRLIIRLKTTYLSCYS